MPEAHSDDAFVVTTTSPRPWTAPHSHVRHHLGRFLTCIKCAIIHARAPSNRLFYDLTTHPSTTHIRMDGFMKNVASTQSEFIAQKEAIQQEAELGETAAKIATKVPVSPETIIETVVTARKIRTFERAAPLPSSLSDADARVRTQATRCHSSHSPSSLLFCRLSQPPSPTRCT
jgi:hypothetical protein